MLTTYFVVMGFIMFVVIRTTILMSHKYCLPPICSFLSNNGRQYLLPVLATKKAIRVKMHRFFGGKNRKKKKCRPSIL
jgi:hypothetical protein